MVFLSLTTQKINLTDFWNRRRLKLREMKRQCFMIWITFEHLSTDYRRMQEAALVLIDW